MARDLEAPMSGTDPPPNDVLATGLLGLSGSGMFSVVMGRRWRDKILACCLGHRRSGPVQFGLTVTPTSTGQRWVRSIDGRSPVTARSIVDFNGADGTLVETFLGVVRLILEPEMRVDGARVEARGLALALGPLAIPLPERLLPDITAQTQVQDGGGLWVRVSARSRRGEDILTYEGVLS